MEFAIQVLGTLLVIFIVLVIIDNISGGTKSGDPGYGDDESM